MFAQSDALLRKSNLWSAYGKATADSARIRILSDLALTSTSFLNNDKLADSIGDLAIQIAAKNSDPALRVLAWNNYIEAVDLEKHYEKAMNYAGKALHLCRLHKLENLEWQTLHNMVAIYKSVASYDSAFIQSKRTMAFAEKLKNRNFQVESFLDLGMSLQGKSRMMDALDNYLSALKLTGEIKSKVLLKKCYSRLSDFYNLIKTFDKAIEYKQKEQVLVLTGSAPVDSVELMWTINQKQVIFTRYNNLLNDRSVEKVIDFAIRTNNATLKNFEFALYRKHLLEAEKIDELYEVYNTRYPEELRILSKKNLGTYYRLMAFFKDKERQYDSAYYYFKLAEKEVTADPNLLFRSNFYNRFGQFLCRVGKTKEAIAVFTKAYQLAKDDPWFGKMEFMLTASLRLHVLYAQLGDFEHAYYYSEKNSWLRNAISVLANKEKANRMALEYQIKLDNEKRDIQLRQRKNERNMMAGGIAFLLIVSLLIYRNYRNQKRSNKLLDAAKQKSEELLLNILPYETAEELKTYGKANANRFDEVTVMFTDFRDFTRVSEKLSAEDLVDKINFYFSEFDRIIVKHGIEKIKTIGDAYMCVGGLPVANKTHARDVVSAALELQEFVMSQKALRLSQGQTYFELRIGIHTGPVVAGIVGIKKFAYDIWGDTVNTASRMESSGEVSKVNISGSTYGKVKDDFDCTYRGKIMAKNKGEIDMYFVESVRR